MTGNGRSHRRWSWWRNPKEELEGGWHGGLEPAAMTVEVACVQQRGKGD